MKKQNGFTIVEALFIVVILAIIGAGGYLAYQNLVVKKTSSDTTVTASTSPQPPVKIESEADLDKATTSLDEVKLDDNSADIDKISSTF